MDMFISDVDTGDTLPATPPRIIIWNDDVPIDGMIVDNAPDAASEAGAPHLVPLFRVIQQRADFLRGCGVLVEFRQPPQGRRIASIVVADSMARFAIRDGDVLHTRWAHAAMEVVSIFSATTSEEQSVMRVGNVSSTIATLISQRPRALNASFGQLVDVSHNSNLTFPIDPAH